MADVKAGDIVKLKSGGPTLSRKSRSGTEH
jgi:uncharacterized protein YodC (DUF2158 family)